jgi:hypothetical protein
MLLIVVVYQHYHYHRQLLPLDLIYHQVVLLFQVRVLLQVQMVFMLEELLGLIHRQFGLVLQQI